MFKSSPLDEEKIIPPPSNKGFEDSMGFTPGRDDASIYKFGPHVQVNFEDIFEESREFQDSDMGKSVGMKVNHGCLRVIFDSCNYGIFYILSILIGWISAIVCGLAYGINMTCQVWFVQPVIKLLFTWFRLCFACNRACVRACCDPCCQSFGQSLAYIRGRFRTDVSGLTFTSQTTNYGATATDHPAEAQ